MAYIALYRKWRPKAFEDVVGQRHITETLQKAIEKDKVAHAYLFSGPRGTGKTSTAKIFARAMNCVHGPTPHPCNECESCRHIIDGESMDVVEIDAASNRSIDDIRNLRETIKFMPAEGHKKVYIIDEVHMLTTEAFNALLKTLEEPPSHVIFILATTEPEKIPMTILSRCQRYEFRRITSADIAERLLYVAQEEHIDITKGAAHILAVQADGGMRDALSMLDQCVSNGEGQIDEELVRRLLGLVGRDWLFSLAHAVCVGDGQVIIQSVDDVIRMGKEPRVILTELVRHLRALMLYKAAPKSDTLAAYADSMDALGKQAEEFDSRHIFYILQTLQQSLLLARTSPTPRVAVEMGLLMASQGERPSEGIPKSADGGVIEALSQRVAHLERLVSTLSKEGVEKKDAIGHGQDKAPATEEEWPIPETDEPAPYIPEPVDDASLVTKRPAARSVAAEKKEPLSTTPVHRQKETPVDDSNGAAKVTDTNGDSLVNVAQYGLLWKKILVALKAMRKPQVYSCISLGKVVFIGDGEIIISVSSTFMASRANREDYLTYVNAAAESVLGKGYHMRAFVHDDPALGDYEKKNSKSEMTRSPMGLAEEKESLQEEPPVKDGDGEDMAWKSVGIDTVSAEERAALEPLLQTLGDCHIYIEEK